MKGSDEWITKKPPKMNYMTPGGHYRQFSNMADHPPGQNMITPNRPICMCNTSNERYC